MTLQRTATHCNTLQHTATHCITLHHTASHCNTLQHTAIHCNTLQHTATHWIHEPCEAHRYTVITRHGTHMIQSCSIFQRFSHVSHKDSVIFRKSDLYLVALLWQMNVTHMIQSCTTHKWVTSHIMNAYVREVGGWGRDPKICTGRHWGMGPSTI